MAFLNFLLLTASTLTCLQGQTVTPDCVLADSIWKKMGMPETIPSNCCGGYNYFGIRCSTKQRITSLYQKLCC
jgi:hypothetical protein